MRIPGPLRVYRTRLDWYLVIPILVLLVEGMLAVYSATEFPESPRAGFFARHLVTFPVALAVMLIAMSLPLRLLDDLAYPAYAVTLLLLAATLVVGIEVYGARRWLGYGPARIQPSEVAKVTTMLALARYLIGKRNDPGRVKHLLVSLAIVAVPSLLVLKQPDLGTSGTFVVIGLCMLLWSGLPMLTFGLLASPLLGLLLVRHTVLWLLFMAGSLVGLWRLRMSWIILGGFLLAQVTIFVGAPRIWGHLEPYQKSRLTTFLDPGKDPAGAGYQIMQSKIAIGSGGLAGKGYLKGSQKALAFLPQQHTDFIFSVVGEELGFWGTGIAVLLFFWIVSRGFYLALHSRNRHAGLLAVGCSAMILYHAGVNMGMTLGLLPVTGLPLPLISFGGTFMISIFFILGLLLNVSAHRYDY